MFAARWGLPNSILHDIIRVHGKISHLAKAAQRTLYKLMQGKGQAEIGTVLKLIHALGYDLTVTRRGHFDLKKELS